MELDYLLATAMFLIVSAYIITEAVNLHSVYDVEDTRKEFLMYYDDLKYNFSISKGDLIFNFKVNKIDYVIDGFIVKNSSESRNLIKTLENLNGSYIIAYSPTKDEFIITKNQELLKIIGHYNISAKYKEEEFNNIEILYPKNYTIHYKTFPHIFCNKIFEIPFCVVDKNKNISIKYYGVLDVGR
ncbi:conserved hypothetical protein [Methanocaldococcus vulcanius M7]|uniref:Uncharacterized protein n=1 Tax=Methanocaldococcus vulcanius (strain ATCC 700851 / DSM 12094 / M7) TaxID=579137 RepID=C9RFL7_METVM|nr:hypothetical protein [Methanocaldococcus vulcanius]ACX72369.1 conserved hypothetical protein [Methanocaldococcus vulcanius M7]